MAAKAKLGAAIVIAVLMLLVVVRERAIGDSTAVAVSALSDGTRLLVTFDRSAPFTIDIAALAPRLSLQDGSKTFSLHPVAGQSIISASTSSSEASRQHLDLRFVTAGIPPGLYNLDLPLEHAVLDSLGNAVPIEYRWGPLPLVSIPGTPDEELLRVRRFYVGKVVYPATLADGMGLFCSISKLHATYVVDNPSPRIVSIERSRTVGPALVPNGNDLGDPRGVLALPPLQFTFAVSPVAKMHQVLSNAGAAPLEREAGRECAQPSIVFATSWHAYRTLRFTPLAVRVGSTKADQKALADGRPSIGMTHEQVATIWGYPPDLLDVAALDRLSVWAWPNAKDDRWAHFTGDRADSFTR